MDNNITHELRELVRIFVRSLGVLQKQEAACCGVSIAQCHAIVEIGRTGEVSLNELAEMLNLDNSTTSRTVNNLVDMGLAERQSDESDRRYIKIRLTEQGKMAFLGIEESMELYFASVLKEIPEEKHQQVLESMQLLNRAVKNKKCCQGV